MYVYVAVYVSMENKAHIIALAFVKSMKAERQAPDTSGKTTSLHE